MGVAIRQSKLVNDRVRLHLDIYYKGKSKFENLELFLYTKPKTQQQKEQNKKTNIIAESIKAKRILELQEDRYDIHTGFKSQASFFEYFKKLTQERRYSEGNYGNWTSAQKHLLNFAKGKDLSFSEINETFLNSFKKYLLTGNITKGNGNLSKNSASSYLNKIRAALRQAHEENIITDNPAKRVKGIKLIENRREYLMLEELKLLTKEPCVIPNLKQAFLFSCLTGLRWSDINKLTWKEIIFSEAENIYKINFTQKKTKGVEYHPISQQAYDILGKRGDGEARVFKGLKYSAWHNFRLAQWVMNAGINKKITFHCARHTYATLLLTAGGDIYTVSSLLGHRELKTTQIYAKIINTKKNSVVDLLPNIGI
jgi:integrase